MRAAEKRGPGRPRSAQADAAIAQATLELLLQDGFAALSVEAVAEKAGVSKATIYRRVASKAELVLEAMEFAGVRGPEPVEDTGSFRTDLLEMARRTSREEETGVPLLAFPRLMAEAGLTDPKLHAALAKGFVEPRIAAVETLVRRGIERGDVRPDVDVDIAVNLIFGALIFVGLRTGRDFTRQRGYVERVLDTLLPGIAA